MNNDSSLPNAANGSSKMNIENCQQFEGHRDLSKNSFGKVSRSKIWLKWLKYRRRVKNIRILNLLGVLLQKQEKVKSRVSCKNGTRLEYVYVTRNDPINRKKSLATEEGGQNCWKHILLIWEKIMKYSLQIEMLSLDKSETVHP